MKLHGSNPKYIKLPVMRGGDEHWIQRIYLAGRDRGFRVQ